MKKRLVRHPLVSAALSLIAVGTGMVAAVGMTAVAFVAPLAFLLGL